MGIQKKLTGISIGLKLALMTAVVLIGATSVFTYISIIEQRKDAVDLIRNLSKDLGNSLESILRFSMQEHRSSELNDAFTSLSRLENIESVSLINHRGVITRSSSENMIGVSYDINHRTCSGCHDHGLSGPIKEIDENSGFIYNKEINKTFTLIPIYNAPECSNNTCHAHSSDETVLGVIEITSVTDYFESRLRSTHITLILTTVIIVLVISLILMYFRRKWITRPISELLRGTQIVAMGNLEEIIPEGEGEFGELSDAFNTMQKKLKNIQQRLIMTEKLTSIGKLASGIAHELNNPLTGILSFTDSLLEEIDKADPKQKDLEIIKNETLRCHEIVQNLLNFTRQEKTRFKIVDLNTAVYSTIDLVNRQLSKETYRLMLELDEKLPPVKADIGQIKQVLLNLLLNAKDSMPDGGTITIKSGYERKNRSVYISVEDTGIGIPDEILEKIFEPFFSTKEGKTNGLGLSISWDIIKKHNGDFFVESEVGRGTIFKISIPVSN